MRISDWSSDVCSSDLYLYGEPMARKATFRQPLHEAVEEIGLGDVGGGHIDGQPNMSQLIRPGRGYLQRALLNMRRERPQLIRSLRRREYIGISPVCTPFPISHLLFLLLLSTNTF